MREAGRRDAKTPRSRSRRELGAKRRALPKLQAQYLGLMRHPPKNQQAKVKSIREKKGYEAAIRRARRLAARGRAA